MMRGVLEAPPLYSNVKSWRSVLWTRSTLANSLVLTAIVGLAYFIHSGQMGIYEDDYVYIASPLDFTFQQLVDHIRWALTTLPQGRPLGWALPQTLTFFGWRAAGFQGVYALAFVVMAVNAILFYLLLLRLTTIPYALFGALGFILFPADTTHSFLMHAFGLHTGLVFLLIGSHLVLSRQWFLGYLAAGAALFIYESTFLPFLALPLVLVPWDRRWVGGVIRHLAICLAILAVDFFLRRYVGEMRVMQELSSPTNVLFETLSGMAMGPVVSGLAYFYRFVTPWFRPNLEIAFVSGIAFIILLWTFLRAPFQAQPPIARTIQLPGMTIQFGKRIADLFGQVPLQYLAAGIVMVIFSYGLGFTHFPPISYAGRLTSVHVAAAVGSGFVVGWICTAVYYLAQKSKRQYIVVGLLAFYFASLVGFGVLVQKDFAAAWSNQKALWSAIVRLVPDLQEDTVILVVEDGLPQTFFIDSMTEWTAPNILPQALQFPADWKRVPRVFFTQGDWTDAIKFKNEEWHLKLDQWVPEDLQDYRFTPSKFVLLQVRDGTLARIEGPLNVAGKPFEFKPLGTPVRLPHRPLYRLLME